MSSEIESLRRQLEIHRRNLSFLKEQRARYGIDQPLSLVNQIEYEKERIEELQWELARIEVQKPTPPKPLGRIDENTIARAIQLVLRQERLSYKGLMYRCFKTGQEWVFDIEEDDKSVFGGMPFRPESENVYKYAIVLALEKLGLKSWKADEEPWAIDIMCKVCQGIQKSRYAITNISEWNPNVLFELGLIYGLGKTAFIIKAREEAVPADLTGIEYIEYDDFGQLESTLIKYFQVYLSREGEIV